MPHRIGPSPVVPKPMPATPTLIGKNGPSTVLTGPQNGGITGSWTDGDSHGVWDNAHFGKIEPKSWTRALQSGYWKRKGTGDARYEVPIWRLPPVQIRPIVNGKPAATTKPSQPYLFQASLTIDSDGGGDAYKTDNTGQPQLALGYQGTNPQTYPDPTKIPYVVLPDNYVRTMPGAHLGDIVAVLYNPTGKPGDGRVTYAIAADTGYTDAIGEASIAVAKPLGINPDPNNGGTPNGVTYVLFPGSAFNKPSQGLPLNVDAAAIQARGAELFAAAGGKP